MSELTAEQVRELLRYEPDTGKLYWRERARQLFPCNWSWKVWNKKFSGKEALKGNHNAGYLHGAIFNKKNLAHRVIWLIQTGDWPQYDIDHLNGDKKDNRWTNLRSATKSENGKNKSMLRNNTSGFNGVIYSKAEMMWVAQIKTQKKNIRLGAFKDFEDACSARATANAVMGFSARHGKQNV